jgi:hypothetical protein
MTTINPTTFNPATMNPAAFNPVGTNASLEPFNQKINSYENIFYYIILFILIGAFIYSIYKSNYVSEKKK